MDDIPIVRRSIALLLGAAGFRVFEAGDGAEALEVLQAASALAPEAERRDGGAIDLLITDIMMPFSGVALVQELRARWPAQRVLYMSGFPTDVVHREGMGTLDGPFLAKPFTPEGLLSKVWEALQPRPEPRDAHPSPPAPEPSSPDQRSPLVAPDVLEIPGSQN